MRGLLLVLLSLVLSACEPPPTDVRLPQHNLVVKGVLAAGDSTATIVVMQMREGRFAGYEGEGVAGAHVLLSAGTDTVALAYDPSVECRSLMADNADPGCYTAALPEVVRPGVEYRLVVSVPGRPVVHGRTVVPSLPVLHAQPGAWTIAASRWPSTVRAEEVDVSWSGVSPDALSELRLWRTGGPHCPFLLGGSPDWVPGRMLVTGRNSARFAVSHVDCNNAVPAGELEAWLGIWAYDQNYSGYAALRAREGLRDGEAAWGIQGASGVFGSVSSTRQPVLVRVAAAAQ
jgi:hypothetical protein